MLSIRVPARSYRFFLSVFNLVRMEDITGLLLDDIDVGINEGIVRGIKAFNWVRDTR